MAQQVIVSIDPGSTHTTVMISKIGEVGSSQPFTFWKSNYCEVYLFYGDDGTILIGSPAVEAGQLNYDCLTGYYKCGLVIG